MQLLTLAVTPDEWSPTLSLPMVDKRNVKAPPASPAYPEFGRIVDAKIPRIGSNAKVASAIGVTPEMVRRYRLGIAMPRDRELEKLAALIGMAFRIDMWKLPVYDRSVIRIIVCKPEVRK